MSINRKNTSHKSNYLINYHKQYYPCQWPHLAWNLLDTLVYGTSSSMANQLKGASFSERRIRNARSENTLLMLTVSWPIVLPDLYYIWTHCPARPILYLDPLPCQTYTVSGPLSCHTHTVSGPIVLPDPYCIWTHCPARPILYLDPLSCQTYTVSGPIVLPDQYHI